MHPLYAKPAESLDGLPAETVFLDARDNALRSCSGLERMPFLRRIDLSHNPLTCVKALAHCVRPSGSAPVGRCMQAVHQRRALTSLDLRGTEVPWDGDGSGGLLSLRHVAILDLRLGVPEESGPLMRSLRTPASAPATAWDVQSKLRRAVAAALPRVLAVDGVLVSAHDRRLALSWVSTCSCQLAVQVRQAQRAEAAANADVSRAPASREKAGDGDPLDGACDVELMGSLHRHSVAATIGRPVRIPATESSRATASSALLEPTLGQEKQAHSVLRDGAQARADGRWHGGLRASLPRADSGTLSSWAGTAHDEAGPSKQWISLADYGLALRAAYSAVRPQGREVDSSASAGGSGDSASSGPAIVATPEEESSSTSEAGVRLIESAWASLDPPGRVARAVAELPKTWPASDRAASLLLLAETHADTVSLETEGFKFDASLSAEVMALRHPRRLGQRRRQRHESPAAARSRREESSATRVPSVSIEWLLSLGARKLVCVACALVSAVASRVEGDADSTFRLLCGLRSHAEVRPQAGPRASLHAQAAETPDPSRSSVADAALAAMLLKARALLRMGPARIGALILCLGRWISASEGLPAASASHHEVPEAQSTHPGGEAKRALPRHIRAMELILEIPQVLQAAELALQERLPSSVGAREAISGHAWAMLGCLDDADRSVALWLAATFPAHTESGRSLAVAASTVLTRGERQGAQGAIPGFFRALAADHALRAAASRLARPKALWGAAAPKEETDSLRSALAGLRSYWSSSVSGVRVDTRLALEQVFGRHATPPDELPKALEWHHCQPIDSGLPLVNSVAEASSAPSAPVPPTGAESVARRARDLHMAAMGQTNLAGAGKPPAAPLQARATARQPRSATARASPVSPERQPAHQASTHRAAGLRSALREALADDHHPSLRYARLALGISADVTASSPPRSIAAPEGPVPCRGDLVEVAVASVGVELAPACDSQPTLHVRAVRCVIRIEGIDSGGDGLAWARLAREPDRLCKRGETPLQRQRSWWQAPPFSVGQHGTAWVRCGSCSFAGVLPTGASRWVHASAESTAMRSMVPLVRALTKSSEVLGCLQVSMEPASSSPSGPEPFESGAATTGHQPWLSRLAAKVAVEPSQTLPPHDSGALDGWGSTTVPGSPAPHALHPDPSVIKQARIAAVASGGGAPGLPERVLVLDTAGEQPALPGGTKADPPTSASRETTSNGRHRQHRAAARGVPLPRSPMQLRAAQVCLGGASAESAATARAGFSGARPRQASPDRLLQGPRRGDSPLSDPAKDSPVRSAGGAEAADPESSLALASLRAFVRASQAPRPAGTRHSRAGGIRTADVAEASAARRRLLASLPVPPAGSDEESEGTASASEHGGSPLSVPSGVSSDGGAGADFGNGGWDAWRGRIPELGQSALPDQAGVSEGKDCRRAAPQSSRRPARPWSAASGQAAGHQQQTWSPSARSQPRASPPRVGHASDQLTGETAPVTPEEGDAGDYPAVHALLVVPSSVAAVTGSNPVSRAVRASRREASLPGASHAQTVRPSQPRVLLRRQLGRDRPRGSEEVQARVVVSGTVALASHARQQRTRVAGGTAVVVGGPFAGGAVGLPALRQ